MAKRKTEAFEARDIKLAILNKALSHPARVAILRMLSQENMHICGELVNVLPLAQSTVSQHLKELKKANLIISKTEGIRSCYYINQKALKEFFEDLKAFFNSLTFDSDL